jgi:uncharacterized repeat protein (TIGR03803 family)
MRKFLSVIAFTTYVLFAQWGQAQKYEILAENGQNETGGNPLEIIQMPNGKIYGLANSGGKQKNGVIFSYDRSTNNYQVLINLNTAIGAESKFVQVGSNKFYWISSSGVMSYDVATNTLKTIYTFSWTGGYGVGVVPSVTNKPSFILANDGILYGTIASGGTNNLGILFSINPSDDSFVKLVDFNGTNGSKPHSLIKSAGSKLYGLAYEGGTNSKGTLYEFDTSNNTLTTLFHFGSTNGDNPFSLSLGTGNILYGTAIRGGSGNFGTVFQYNIANNTLATLINFNGTNGKTPNEVFEGSDGKLYGITSGDIISMPWIITDLGSIFTYNLSNSAFNTLQQFNISYQSRPIDLKQGSDGNLYGNTGENLSNPNFSGCSFFSYNLTNFSFFAHYQTSGNVNATDFRIPSFLQGSDNHVYAIGWGDILAGGSIYSFNQSNTNFAKLFSFDLNFIGHSYAGGGLIKAGDGNLYGISTANNLYPNFLFKCVPTLKQIYVYKPNTSIKNNAGMIKANNGLLYAAAEGNFFSYNTTNNVVTSLSNAIQQIEIVSPSIIANNGKIYGVVTGKQASYGNLYSYDIASNTFTTHLNFNGTNGVYPFGLIEGDDGLLYGTTGIYGNGAPYLANPSPPSIFRFNPANNTFTTLVTGNVLYYWTKGKDGKFYGIRNSNTIARFDPSNNTITNLYTPINSLGIYINNLITGLDGNLYGTNGDFFMYDIASNTYTVLVPNVSGKIMQDTDYVFYGIKSGNSDNIYKITLPVFVRTDGNDTNNGRGNSDNTSKRTIQAAINAADEGETIYLVAGIGGSFFDESVTINKNITIKTIGNVSVKNITVQGGKTVDLQSPLGISGLLKLEGNSTFTSNGNLTLLSNNLTTAMVDNSGGNVVGNVTYQRYLGDYSYRTSVQGYTYFSSPTSGSKISDFNDNVSIVLNPAYDFVSAYTGAFPNFFRYNESKVVTSPTNFNVFEKGWESPASLAENLQVGRGYILNLNTNTLVDFKGSLNGGTINIPITKGTATNSGWNLVGNPYPSSLDWEKA